MHSPPAAIYNRETDTWRRIADVPAPWSGEASQPHTVSHENKVYVYRDRWANSEPHVDIEMDPDLIWTGNSAYSWSSNRLQWRHIFKDHCRAD